MLANLDVVLSFAVIMLGVSMMVMVLTQTLSALLNLRGARLRAGLEELFEQAGLDEAERTKLATSILLHPLLSDGVVWRRLAPAIRKEELVRLMDTMKQSRDFETIKGKRRRPRFPGCQPRRFQFAMLGAMLGAMKRSMLYLGEPATYEQLLSRQATNSLADLHVSAQRVAWGIIMGPRLGLDLDAEVRETLRHHGDHFAAQMAAAFARRAQHREREADQHLSRARELQPPGHPWAALVPSDEAWRSVAIEPKLEEDAPGRVYRIVADNRPKGAVFGNRGVGRLLRMRSGELLFVNPVELPDTLAEEIRGLGDVTHIILPAKYHSDHAAGAKKLFPKARLWGVLAHKNYPGVKHLEFDGFLDDSAPLFPGELEHVTLRGVDVGDAWLLDRASRTLITTDAVFLMGSGAAGNEIFKSPFSTFYGWAWGVFDRVGIPSYQPLMWSDLSAYQASLKRAFELDFDHAASCHGSWRCIEGNARQALAERLGWMLELGRLGGIAHLGNFVRRHPGIFYRFVKEQIAARRSG